MKEKKLQSLFLVAALFIGVSAFGQPAGAPVNSLNENFDVKCAAGSGVPSDWTSYNPVIGTGKWHCSATDGRANASGPTPGMICTGIVGTTYHEDTAYLLTPMLDISSYVDKVYLRFDARNDVVYFGAKLSLLVTGDTTVKTYVDSTKGVFPIFGNSDSTGWVTHECQITNCKTAPFYIAFRYTSTNTTGSIWHIDNVRLATVPILGVPVQNATGAISLTVVSPVSGNDVKINFTTNSGASGPYLLTINDMLGREVHREIINVHGGSEGHIISGLNLHEGMYLVKMSNGSAGAVARLMLQ